MKIVKKYTKYYHNVSTVKRYGNNFIKLQTMNVQRTPGTQFEDIEQEQLERIRDKTQKYDVDINTPSAEVYKIIHNNDLEPLLSNISNKNVNSTNVRYEESLIRSKRLVFEYAMSNDWQYFCTFTIDKNKYDRYDLNEYHKSFSHWLRNYFRRQLKYDVQYILIPEQHQDGAWHEHGLFSNFPLSELKAFQYDKKLPLYIKNKIADGNTIYDCPKYREKFGFCTFEPVRSSEACAKYITKYITKDIFNSSIESGHKLYYASRKLKRAEIVATGIYDGIPFYDYENQYCKMATFKYSDEFLNTIKSKIEVIK